MVGGLRCAHLSISETADLLGFSLTQSLVLMWSGNKTTEGHTVSAIRNALLS